MSANTSRVITRAELRAVVFDAVGYRPHPGQRTIHASRARHKVVSAGRRFGKSSLGGHELTVEAQKTRLLLPSLIESGKRKTYWLVGPEYTDAEKEFRAVYDDLKRLGAPFDKPGTYYNAFEGSMQISLFGGRFLVLGKSAKHPEQLVGEGLDGVVMAEAAKMKDRIWSRFIRPMLADTRGWSLHTSTPEGRNHFYDLWNRGQSELEPEWESWRMPAYRNPVVYPGGRNDPEIIALQRDLTPEAFAQEIEASFTEMVGRVFKDWDEEIHVRDLRFDPALPTYAASDFGFTNPFVWLLVQVDAHGTVLVIDELYQAGLTIDEAADEIRARGLCPSSLREFYPDPASPGDSRVLEQKLKLRAMPGTGGELENRLRIIRAALRVRNEHLPEGDPARVPRLFVNRRCVNTIREFSAYRYPSTRADAANANEKPMKRDDHTPEALGRFMVGKFGKGEKTHVRVRSGSFGR